MRTSKLIAIGFRISIIRQIFATSDILRVYLITTHKLKMHKFKTEKLICNEYVDNFQIGPNNYRCELKLKTCCNLLILKVNSLFMCSTK